MKQNKKKCYFELFAMASFLYWGNNHLQTTRYLYENERLPLAFDNYKIVQISDLQSKVFGKEQSYLFRKIKEEAPNVIFITGDLIDRNRTDIDASMILIRKIITLAPVYFVSGNHEYQSGYYEEILFQLECVGVHILENDIATISVGGESVCVLGLADIRGNQNYSFVLNQLDKRTKGQFRILLSHRPEILHLYAEKEMDLVFAGHAHGGQIDIPFIGPIFAPNQGFFPKQTKGMHRQNNTNLVISRGLGNSRFPFRIFNRPEIVTVTLKKAIQSKVKYDIL